MCYTQSKCKSAGTTLRYTKTFADTEEWRFGRGEIRIITLKEPQEMFDLLQVCLFPLFAEDCRADTLAYPESVSLPCPF